MNIIILMLIIISLFFNLVLYNKVKKINGVEIKILKSKLKDCLKNLNNNIDKTRDLKKSIVIIKKSTKMIQHDIDELIYFKIDLCKTFDHIKQGFMSPDDPEFNNQRSVYIFKKWDALISFLNLEYNGEAEIMKGVFRKVDSNS